MHDAICMFAHGFLSVGLVLYLAELALGQRLIGARSIVLKLSTPLGKD
jgi:hypothetical protein